MTRRHVILCTIPFFLLGIPAYAYGDPTGGTLFSVLLPMLAAVWAMFLIFANRIRRGISGLLSKLRGSKPQEQPHREAGEKHFPRN
jgi:hypothetical protein